VPALNEIMGGDGGRHSRWAHDRQEATVPLHVDSVLVPGLPPPHVADVQSLHRQRSATSHKRRLCVGGGMGVDPTLCASASPATHRTSWGRRPRRENADLGDRPEQVNISAG
jgi:hypothetical protein